MYIFYVKGNYNNINKHLSGISIKINNNTFIGNINYRIADELWIKLCNDKKITGIIMATATNNEQKLLIKCYGTLQNTVIKIDDIYASTLK